MMKRLFIFKNSKQNIIKTIKSDMDKLEEIGEVVIVGGGPVGNLSAVLASFIGAKTTVYQKRETYTRQINLRIELDLIEKISKVFQKIGRRKDKYFQDLHQMLVDKDGKILLNYLQKSLKQKAQQLGAKYVFGKQIKSFKQVYDIHEKNNPIILDCSGRNSFLRVNEFGTDAQNMKIENLHHALHINFDTVITNEFDFRLMYSILTNTNDLMLGDIVVSKQKNKENGKNGKVHVTIPLFVSESLSKIFDQNYPNINRIPLRPFSYKKQDFIMQDDVQNLLYSIFCPFLMEDWDIDWKSVVVKKINITCGYAVKRSSNRYVCLGDSAAHFAYFKSLNFGLKHAFEFMLKLSSFYGFKCNLPQFNQQECISLCKSSYPPLIIKQAKPGPSPAQYFIKTEAIIYSAMVFNVAYNSINKLDILPVFFEQKVERLWNQYIQQSHEENWQKYLDKFEKDREGDIDTMILSNKGKKNGTQFISHLIWIDNLVPLKLADFLNFATKGYSMFKKDFDYFAKIFKILKKQIEDKDKFRQQVIKCIEQTQNLISKQTPKQFLQFNGELRKICTSDQFSMEQFVSLVEKMKWQKKNYEYKTSTMFLKILNLLAKIYTLGKSQKK